MKSRRVICVHFLVSRSEYPIFHIILDDTRAITIFQIPGYVPRMTYVCCRECHWICFACLSLLSFSLFFILFRSFCLLSPDTHIVVFWLFPSVFFLFSPYLVAKERCLFFAVIHPCLSAMDRVMFCFPV